MRTSLPTRRTPSTCRATSSLACGHALDYLVYARLQRGDDARAADRYRELLDLGAANPGVHAVDEHVVDIQARYALERRAFTEAAALDVPARFDDEPRFAATLLFARAWGAARLGDAVVARRDADRLPSMIEALSNQGEDYYASSVRIWHVVARAWIAWAAGDHARALQRMREAAALDDATAYVGNFESSADALVHTHEELGDLLLELDRPAAALDAYQRSLETSPNRFNALLGSTRAARLAGEEGTARRYYQALLDAAKGSERVSLAEAREYVAAR